MSVSTLRIKKRGGAMSEQVYSMTATEAVAFLLAKCAKDEPVFVLVAHDSTAHHAVMEWADRAESVGVPALKVAGAWETAAAMLQWPNRKLPG